LEPIKILIADGNETFRSDLQRTLNSRYLVQSCADGKEAKALIRTFQPHILITELLLREFDGLSLIHDAADLPYSPAVLVVTIFSNDFIKEELTKLDVGGIVLKPTSMRTLAGHIHQIAKSINPIYSARAELFISKRLQALGIPCHRDGSNQLKAAIPMYTEDPTQPLNKVIYAKVAEKCGFSDPKQVEHSIRTAINTAWNQRTGTCWDDLFPCGKPTNKVFISTLSTQLSQYLLQADEPAGE
jgi:CheY-like chemotaxis protein